MAIDVKKVEVWVGTLQDQSGALARVLNSLAEAGADLDGVIARRNENMPGEGTVFVTPIKGRKVQNAASEAGLKRADVATLRVEGSNRPGMGSKLTQAVAEAGINMRGLSAFTMGNKYVAFVGFDNDADATKAMRALRSVDTGARSTKTAARPGPARGRRSARAGVRATSRSTF